MANLKISELTENTSRHFNDLAVMVDDPAGTPLTQKTKFLNLTGLIVNAQTGTSYTYLTGDYGKLVTHTNGSAIAGTLPQAGASFPANWFMFVQNRGAGALTITPTTSTIDGAATLLLNQNEGALIVSDGTNYFTARGKATGAGGVGDVTGPGSSTDNALVRFDSTTGKLIQNSTVTLDDTGALTVPEMAAPSTPGANKVALYAKSDGKLYIKDDAGTETDLTATGGAPSGSAGGDLTGTYPNPRVAQVNDANGNELLKFGTTASAVNEVTVTNKATGNAPTVEATGGDTNIDLNLVSKGTGVVQANGNALAFKNAEINAQTGTTYTLQASDNGKIVTCSNASAITVTVPSGLGAGFNCLVIQIGAGQVTFSPSSTTVNHRQSHTKIAGQYGIATLAAYASNVFALGGDTSA